MDGCAMGWQRWRGSGGACEGEWVVGMEWFDKMRANVMYCRFLGTSVQLRHPDCSRHGLYAEGT